MEDGKNLVLRPGRASRPKRVAFILRGLPGSGKTYLSKVLREVEEREGGDAPRIHSLDDYFVTVRGVRCGEMLLYAVGYVLQCLLRKLRTSGFTHPCVVVPSPMEVACS